MGVGKIREIGSRLIDHGLAPATPVAVISWGTYARQKTVVGTLSDIGERVETSGITAPAVTVVGEVVKFRETLNWFESKPLFGKRVVVTRTREQAGELSARLRFLGADVTELPTIRIERVDAGAWMGAGLSTGYDWIVFTSPNAVMHFLDQVIALKGDIRAIGTAQIAVVGPATAAKVREYGLKVNLESREKTAKALSLELGTHLGCTTEKKRVLWPHGNLAEPVMTHELVACGIECIGLEVYRTTPETADPYGQRKLLESTPPDWIVFASGSAVENYFRLALKIDYSRVRFSVIGPETARKLRAQGIKDFIQADQPTVESLADSLLKKLH